VRGNTRASRQDGDYMNLLQEKYTDIQIIWRLHEPALGKIHGHPDKMEIT
jgi:hypothetical protein